MIDATERWLPVVGWEGIYEVSDLGRVRSLPRGISGGRRIKGRVLALTVDDSGTHTVLLRDSPRRRHVHIYILVAEAFIGPRPAGLQIRHLNDDRTDNRLANLTYGTQGENMVDAVLNGKHGNTKLTVDNVREIRRRYAAGESQAAVAADYGVKPITVQAVVKRRNWKHVA